MLKLSVFKVLLLLGTTQLFAQMKYDAYIEVHAANQLGELYNFWSVRNFTSQDIFATPEGVNLMTEQHALMREVNCVRLMGGRSDGKNIFFKGVDADGELECDFSLLIEYLQGILDGGFTPRIVLDNVPNAMTAKREVHKYGNTHPPDDYGVYHEYIKRLTGAMIEAFGYREVSRWRFRVGTEPDLYPGHWAGSLEEYLKLYDYAVHAVTSLIPDADIGPGNIMSPSGYRGIRKPTWGLDIIDHAATGTNYFTGGIGTRMTFFSCSWYDGIGENGGVEGLVACVDAIRERLGKYPKFRGIPVEIAEFMILHDKDRRRLWSGDATEWGASWFSAVTKQVYQKNIADVHLWSTTTEGVPMPHLQVMAFLGKQVGGQRIEVVERIRAQAKNKVGVVASTREGSIYLLLYHHDKRRAADETFTLNVVVKDPRITEGSKWIADQWQIDAHHGVFIREYEKDCLAAGLEPLENSAEYDGSIVKWFGPEGAKVFREEIEKYRALSADILLDLQQPIETGSEVIQMDIELPAHSVRMIRLHPESTQRKK